MQLTITGRQFSVEDALRRYVESKIDGIVKSKRLTITSVNVVLSVERRNRFRADISVAYKPHEAYASVESYDMYIAIDEAADKIEVQLDKFLGKVQKKQSVPLRDIVGTEIPELEEEAYEDVFEEEYE